MDIFNATIILWITFGLFILVVITLIIGFASSIFISSNKRIHKETRTIEDTNFGASIEKTNSTPVDWCHGLIMVEIKSISFNGQFGLENQLEANRLQNRSQNLILKSESYGLTSLIFVISIFVIFIAIFLYLVKIRISQRRHLK